MERNDVLAEIYLLAAEILKGTATADKIRQVTKLAIENNCQKELREELASISEQILHKKLS